ncbi:MAG: four helix bundle protein [Candidatus Moranbacteria bacterium]|nr:four helix bundle protein [Candidatus Moranbacteria bacterium]
MDTLPIINRTYEVYKFAVETNGHIEKRFRYSLGESLESSILALLQELIMAKNAPKPMKSGYLIRAGSHLEVTAFKLRLLLELKLANETRIFQTQAKLAEIGRMQGGWLRSLNT